MKKKQTFGKLFYDVACEFMMLPRDSIAATPV